MIYLKKKELFIGLIAGLAFLGILVLPNFCLADHNQTVDFFVDPDYDIFSRNNITTQLIKKTNKINFFIDEELNQSLVPKIELDNKLYDLSTNFEYQIFPKLTNLYGLPKEWKDPEWRLAVVFHSLKKNYGGYARVQDIYSQQTSNNSNNISVIFLNIDSLKQSSYQLTSYLAHEFSHLLTINLKTSQYSLLDEIWLEELRAELSENITQNINENFPDSILKKRLESFIYVTNFSFLNWQNADRDYAIVNLLGHYLREKYGDNILKDSLNSPFKGVESINYALQKNDFNVTFQDIVQNWMIASVINDCSVNELYCYKNPYLESIKVTGDTYFIPTKFETQMIGTDNIFNSSGKWLKIVGGMDVIYLKFTLDDNVPIFKMPYVIIKTNGTKQLGFLDFSSTTSADLYIDNKNVEAIIVMPFLVENQFLDKKYSYTFEFKSYEKNAQKDQQIIESLLKRIDELKKQVTMLQTQLAMQKTYQSDLNCLMFSQDLYYGMTSPEVECLQQYLANLENNIYPEKLVTGYFGPLTQAAVQRYQEFKGIITTGYFGPLTRTAVNQSL
jgi:hypothetical protein